jgi:hypothetical protein
MRKMILALFDFIISIYRFITQKNMNVELNSADHHSLKISFSNLRCKINISETALFAFVIRFGTLKCNSSGKTSSKYT